MSEVEEKHPKTSDHAHMTFMRANPPTTGHAKVVNTVKAAAKKDGADHHVFLSHSQDAKKNPLSHKQKREYLHKMVPHTHIHKEVGVKTPIDALKHLHKHGYTHVTIHVGEDRHADMHNLVHKYNGKDYHFKHLEVKSAGHRDPDAEGTEGVSGTKMREAATKKDFKTFSKGTHPKHAKEMYHAVRKGMKLENFQAVFLVGGPGSGKDFVLREALKEAGVEISLEKLSSAIEQKRDLEELAGNPPLIVNGNADDGSKIVLAAEILEAIGYRTSMVFVYTENEESRERNNARMSAGRATISEEVRAAKYAASITNMHQFTEVFNEGFFLFDNTCDLNEERAQISTWLSELPTLIEDYYKDMAKMGFHPMRADRQLPPPKTPHPVPTGYERVKDGSFWKLRKIREDVNVMFEASFPTIIDMTTKKQDTKGQKQGNKYQDNGIAVPGNKATEREVVEGSDQEISVPQTQAPGATLDKKKPAKGAKDPSSPYNSNIGQVPSGGIGLTAINVESVQEDKKMTYSEWKNKKMPERKKGGRTSDSNVNHMKHPLDKFRKKRV
jgi:hypothetical protein